ncbi:MAG: hypothetical protein BroJett011_77790 [Chloroflexota bacterium]|nr:MAG: hypothetical protein BroJett011_77790 [Chloroflexota bacterium]
MGYALFEEINYVNGYLQSVNFDEYLLPTTPVIINAIANATGRHVRDLLANLEQVLFRIQTHPKATVSL